MLGFIGLMLLSAGALIISLDYGRRGRLPEIERKREDGETRRFLREW